MVLEGDAMDYLEIMDLCGFDPAKADALVNEILIESGLEKNVESIPESVSNAPGAAGSSSKRESEYRRVADGSELVRSYYGQHSADGLAVRL